MDTAYSKKKKKKKSWFNSYQLYRHFLFTKLFHDAILQKLQDFGMHVCFMHATPVKLLS